MVTAVVRKPIPQGNKQEEKNLETELQDQQDMSGKGNHSLDALFDAACEGYKGYLSKILVYYNIISASDINNFLQNKKNVMVLFMTLNFQPTSTQHDSGWTKISNVSSMPDDYLAYLLNLDEKTIKDMDAAEKRELITSLPESSIGSRSSKDILIHPAFIALSAEPEVRPLLGAALYLAGQSGETYTSQIANKHGWRDTFFNTYIPTAYISEAAKKYGVSNDIYLKALQSFKKVKSRFIQN